jgi:hypothetical protein
MVTRRHQKEAIAAFELLESSDEDTMVLEMFGLFPSGHVVNYQEINASYRELARLIHPSRGGSFDAPRAGRCMATLTRAFEIVENMSIYSNWSGRDCDLEDVVVNLEYEVPLDLCYSEVTLDEEREMSDAQARVEEEDALRAETTTLSAMGHPVGSFCIWSNAPPGVPDGALFEVLGIASYSESGKVRAQYDGNTYMISPDELALQVTDFLCFAIFVSQSTTFALCSSLILVLFSRAQGRRRQRP